MFGPNWCDVKNTMTLQWKLINWWYVTGLIKYDQTVIKNSCHRSSEWLGITWRLLMGGISGHIYCVVRTNRWLIYWNSWLTAVERIHEEALTLIHCNHDNRTVKRTDSWLWWKYVKTFIIKVTIIVIDENKPFVSTSAQPFLIAIIHLWSYLIK